MKNVSQSILSILFSVILFSETNAQAPAIEWAINNDDGLGGIITPNGKLMTLSGFYTRFSGSEVLKSIQPDGQVTSSNEIYSCQGSSCTLATLGHSQNVIRTYEVEHFAERGSIVLQVGFESKPNTVFRANIVGCN
jgi:hypothetical protein